MRNRKLIKHTKTIFTLLVILTMLLMSPAALAAELDTPAQSIDTLESEITPFAEETQWYYIIDGDGVLWGRLWSLTHGVWLTDWVIMAW